MGALGPELSELEWATEGCWELRFHKDPLGGVGGGLGEQALWELREEGAAGVVGRDWSRDEFGRQSWEDLLRDEMWGERAAGGCVTGRKGWGVQLEEQM